MRSKGGLKIYLCPHCKSQDIQHMTKMVDQNSGVCLSCNTWWPWSSRLKVNVEREDHVEIRKETGFSRIGLNNV